MRTFVRLALISLIALLVVPAQAQEAQPPAQNDPSRQIPVVIVADVLERAEARLEAEDYEGALLDYSLFIYLNPTFSEGYFRRAISYVRQAQFDEAIADLDRALEIAPDAPNYRAAVLLLRGAIHADQERTEAALADYSEAITLAPSVEAYVNRAVLYLRASDYENALPDLDEAIELVADDPVLFFYRGLVHSAMENRPEAAADYLSFFDLIETRSLDNELRPNEVIALQMDQGLVYRLPFEASAGERVSLFARIRPGDQGDPLMVLTGPDGAALIADDDSGGGVDALILDYPLREDGTYTLVVSHSLSGYTGQMAVGMVIEGRTE